MNHTLDPETNYCLLCGIGAIDIVEESLITCSGIGGPPMREYLELTRKGPRWIRTIHGNT